MDTFLKSFLSVRAHPGAVGKVAAKPVGGNGVYSWAEVAKHNTPEDAWLVVEGQVYDVSGWAPQHPGGSVIYSYAGQDATDVFQALHKGAAGRAVLRTRRIGSVPSQDPTAPALPAVVSDFRALYKRASEQGLLKARPQYYAWKVSELVAMLAFSMFLLYRFGDSSVLARWVSALVLTVFTSQCGWTCHDFLHNQVFTSRRANELAGGAILCFGMGGSMHWWKTKHNQHHATPNKLGEGDHPEDPDIDTVPLIAWSRELKDQVDSKARWMIHMQHVLIWPLLALAYVNWVLQGLLHIVMYPGIPLRHRMVELAVILAHHGLLNYSIFSNLSLTHALTYWVIVHGLSGFYTAFVFVQSHNGMEVWSGQKDFVTAQIVTTRNVAPNAVLDWFFGGLNYQIEHHLFPTMPRHNFKAVRPMVMELCAKHGLPYESLSLAGSTLAVYRTLADLAATKDE